MRPPGPNLKHVQISENNREGGQRNTGWADLLRALRESSYDRSLTIDGASLGAFSAAVAIWRDIERESKRAGPPNG